MIEIDWPDGAADWDSRRQRPARGRTSMVATAHPLASRAAFAILAQGGSAADAAVAAQMVLTVVEPNASGIGGGTIVLHHAPDGTVTALDGLAAAPARVVPRLEIDLDGRILPRDRVMTGGRAAGVPGTVRVLELLHRRHGRLPWARLFDDAVTLAQAGFALQPYLAGVVRDHAGIAADPASAALWFMAGGGLRPVGAIVRNPELARTLQRLAEGGADAFYQGPVARSIVAAVAASGFPGFIEERDLADYRAVERQPLRLDVLGHQVWTMPPPVFGGLAVLQLLALAERRGFVHLPEEGAEAVHLLAEAGRLAFADRSVWLGDPDFVDVPVAGLLDPGYLDERARLIAATARPGRAEPGHPPGAGAAGGIGVGMASSLTSHLSIADGAGAVVSMTTTINQNFGARLAPSGFYLNNVQTNFARFDQTGGRPARNRAEPGKRPITSMAPMLVRDPQGQPVLAIGAGGGNRIVGYVANGILRSLVGGLDPQAALNRPHVLNPNAATEIEPGLAHLAPDLSQRGHELVVRRMDGGCQALRRYADGSLEGGADPRRDGLAIGV